ncbi:DUF895 domain membrane protein, variant 2 [Balamuthia mandrillaris]
MDDDCRGGGVRRLHRLPHSHRERGRPGSCRRDRLWSGHPLGRSGLLPHKVLLQRYSRQKLWGIFQFSNVFGNMAAFFVFKYLSTTALFVIFTSLAVTGTAMLLFIRWPIAAKPTSTITTTEEEEEDKEEQTSKHRLDKQQGQEHINSSSCYTEHSPLIPENGDIQPQKVVNERKQGAMSASLAIVRAVVVNQLGDWDVLLLLPMFFWTGLELAFWTGEFPLVLDEKVIGLVLMFTGIAEMIGGIVVGWLSDKFLGRSITVLLGSLLYALALLLSVFLKHGRFFHPQLLSASSASSSSSSSGEESDDEERLPLIAIVAAVCFGLGDCIFNTQTYAMLGELSSLKSPLSSSSSSCSSSSSSSTSKEDSAYAVGSFTIFQLLQNLGGALGFVLPLVLPFHGQHSTPTHHHSHLFLLLRRESSQVGDEEDDEEKGGSMGQIWIQSGVLGLAALCYLVARLRYRRALKQRQHHHPSLPPPPPPQPQKPLLQIN